MSNIYKGAGFMLSQNPVMIFSPDLKESKIEDFPNIAEELQEITQIEQEEELPNPVEIIEAAKLEAEKIRADAKKEIAAQKEAFELEIKQQLEIERKKGYDIGLLEGAEKKSADIEAAIARISSSIDEIKLNFNDFMDEQRSDLITLVLEVTEKILAKRLENDDYIMLPVIQKALQSIKLKSHCAISVSEEAVSLLAFLKKELINAQNPDSAMFEVLAKDMPLDFCVLEVDEQLLDISISTQFENIGNFLKHNED